MWQTTQQKWIKLKTIEILISIRAFQKFGQNVGQKDSLRIHFIILFWPNFDRFFWKFWYQSIRKTMQNGNMLRTQIEKYVREIFTRSFIIFFFWNEIVKSIPYKYNEHNISNIHVHIFCQRWTNLANKKN